MKRLSVITTLFILFIPLDIKALKCSDKQIDTFEKLANEIQTTFDYEEKDGGVKFTINFHNVNKDLYLVDYDTFDFMAIYENNNNNIILAPDYAPGRTYTFNVVNNNNICDLSIIKTLKVTTPNYNKFYSDPICSGIENYSLCQKWTNNGNISYEQFKKNVQEYKKKNEAKEPVISNDIEDNGLNRFRNFIAKYYIYITIGVVLIATLIIIIVRNHKKDMKW